MPNATEKQPLPALSEEAYQKLLSIFASRENEQAARENPMEALEMLLNRIEREKDSFTAMLCFVITDASHPRAIELARERKHRQMQQEAA